MLLLWAGIATLGLAAQSVAVRLENDQLRISAPQLHFLVGPPLERLHDGASVNYAFQLLLSDERDARPVARALHRFAVSYDLWEEKFAVTRLEPFPRSVSHLSASAAEAWCLDSLSLPITGLAPDKAFWIRLDFRAEDPKDASVQASNSGLTLSGLIDIFSRRTRDDQLHGS